MVTDRVLSITNEALPATVCNALRNLLILAQKKDVEDYSIRKLIVDDTSMDDEKMELILSGLAEQRSLKSIVLMNCHLGCKGMARLMQLLEQDEDTEVNELRLVSVKMSRDPTSMKLVKSKIKEQEEVGDLRVGQQNEYNRSALCNLLKHIKNNMKKQIFIKRLQLSWMDLYNAREQEGERDCMRYIIKIIEADRGS